MRDVIGTAEGSPTRCESEALAIVTTGDPGTAMNATARWTCQVLGKDREMWKERQATYPHHQLKPGQQETYHYLYNGPSITRLIPMHKTTLSPTLHTYSTPTPPGRGDREWEVGGLRCAEALITLPSPSLEPPPASPADVPSVRMAEEW